MKQITRDYNGLVLNFNISDLNDIKDIINNLKNNKQNVHEIPTDSTIDLLDLCAKKWLDREYSREHVDKLAQITNQSKELVLFELEYVMKGLLKENIFKLLDNELEDRYILDKWVDKHYGKVHRQPRGITFHNVSGNAFIVIPISIAMGLLSKNVNIVKVSKDEPYFAHAFFKSLFEIDESIKDRLSVVYFDSTSEDIYDYVVSNSDCVIHWGGKTSRDYMASKCAKYGVHFIEHGPKISFEVVDEGVTFDDIKGIALDMSLWEQRACLSPRVVFLNSKVDKNEFLENLNTCIKGVTEIFPKEYYDAFSSIKTMQDRQYIVIKNIDKNDFKIYSSKNSDYTIIYSDIPPTNKEIDMCFNRFIFVCPYSSKEEILNYIDENLLGYLQTMGYNGEDFEFIEKVSLKGVSIITKPGFMSMHEPGTSHDGFYNLREMTYAVSYQK
ncbi:MAG: acyl-CoA reductase [Clostridiales bacterium]|nr:acyl-CoA reductase [Clostridiales bacterium]